MDYISEKINRDPVTGKLYVGKKPGDDQAPDTSGSGVPQPEKKGANFSVGGVNPKTKQGFLGVQPGRDPADTFTGRMANRFIPRMDKETGRLYMGTQVGRDSKPKADTATPTASVGTPTTGTPSQDAKDKTAAPKLSSFGAAFKAARESRLAGKSGDTFEYGGKKYTSYQKGEEPKTTQTSQSSKTSQPSKTPANISLSTATGNKPAAGKIVSGSERLDNIVTGGVLKYLPSTYKNRVKESFNLALAEARDQKFTEYDIERQVSHGLDQKYDKNNPEHKKKLML